MDVIALHQAGITNAVATLGTALTPEQARIIKRLKGEVVISYDSDNAGQNATKRAIELFTAEDVKVRVLQQDDGKDPDEYIKTHGTGAFLELIKNAKVQIEFKINKLKEAYDLTNPDDKLKYIGEVAKEFATIKSPVEREIYITKIAEETKVSANAILSEVNRIISAYRKKSEIKQAKDEVQVSKEVVKRREHSQLLESEKILLNLVFYDENVAKYVRGEIDSSYFSSEVNKKLFDLICSVYDQGAKPDVRIFISNFANDTSYIAEVLHDDRNISDKVLAVKQSLNIIKVEHKKQMMNELMKNSAELEKINELYKS